MASVSCLRVRLQALYPLLSQENLFCFMSVIVFVTNNSLLNSIVKYCWFWNYIHTATSFQNKNTATKKVSTYIKVMIYYLWRFPSLCALHSCKSILLLMTKTVLYLVYFDVFIPPTKTHTHTARSPWPQGFSYSTTRQVKLHSDSLLLILQELILFGKNPKLTLQENSQYYDPSP